MKRYIVSGGSLILDAVIINILNMISLVFVARYLGPAEYGLYAYIFSLASLFALIGNLGLDGLFVRELVVHPDREPTVIGTVFALRLAGYTIGAVLLMSVSPFIASTGSEFVLFLLGALSILLTAFTGVLTNWFRAKVDSGVASVASIVSGVMSSGLKVSAVYLGFGVIVVGYAQTAGGVACALMLVGGYLMRSGGSIRQWRIDLGYARQLLAESWKIFLGSAFAIVYLNIDLTLLRLMVGADEAGLYAIPVKIIQASYLIPTALTITAFPYLTRLHRKDVAKFEAALSASYAALALASYLAVFLILVFGQSAIILAFGESYRESLLPLLVLSVSLPFAYSRYVTTRWVILEGRGTYFILSEAVGALLNIVLNVTLIPGFGGVGSAIATVVCLMASSYFSLALSVEGRRLMKLIALAHLNPVSPVVRFFAT